MVQELKSLVASGKSQEAIKRMVGMVANVDEDIHNKLILLSGQIALNQNLSNAGLMELEDYVLSENKTNKALLDTIDAMNADNLLIEGHIKEVDKFKEKTTLLFLASQPLNASILELPKEYLQIRKIFKRHRDRFNITEEFDTNLDSFFDSIYDEKPHIIHFAGHGSEEGIVLSRKTDRQTHVISYEFLASAFKLIKGNTECVFINTINSNLFAKVISRFIPFAIGIRGIVSDAESITFSSGFYAALALEKNYQKAFDCGKSLLTAKNEPVGKAFNQESDSQIPKSYAIGRLDSKPRLDDSKPRYNYCLYINGFCSDDPLAPDDFYTPEQKSTDLTR